MTKIKRLKAAEAEAKRFLKAAKVLREEMKMPSYDWQSFPKESGACHRASMDLTRALAEFRRRDQ